MCRRTKRFTLFSTTISAHKKNDDWLKAHPNVTFRFTPTSASWLNQVEIWFGTLSRKAIKGASLLEYTLDDQFHNSDHVSRYPEASKPAYRLVIRYMGFYRHMIRTLETLG